MIGPTNCSTGVLDESTVEMMEMPRCGNPDKLRKQPPIRKKRFVITDGSRHPSLTTTYKIGRYPVRFNKTRKLVDAQIKKAFDVWSEHAHINFTKTDGDAHINLNFYPRRHRGCDDMFDGPNGTLAHAFSPADGGDVHFDDEEKWVIGAGGSDIFTIAVHELGHALGISHSQANNSIMKPIYKYSPSLKLAGDDIAAIQTLYGVPPERTLSAGSDEPPPDLCRNASIDTITRVKDGTTYVFKGRFYGLLKEDGLAKDYPRAIATDWPGLPDYLDAALTSTDNDTYFFKGDKYWRYTNTEPHPGYPRLIKEDFPGVPNDIEAAFVFNYDRRIYFFKSDKYWRFDPFSTPQVAKHYPRQIADYWSGVPSNLDAAFTWENNQTFFFKGDQYYRYHELDDEVSIRSLVHQRHII